MADSTPVPEEVPIPESWSNFTFRGFIRDLLNLGPLGYWRGVQRDMIVNWDKY